MDARRHARHLARWLGWLPEPEQPKGSPVTIELAGGPLCGLKPNPTSPPNFLWITDEGRCYRKYAAGRYLYRRVSGKGENIVYLYAAGTHVLCGGCGTFHRISDDRVCRLCGKDYEKPKA